MTDEYDMLALDRATGLVHQYGGTAPGGIGSEDMGFGVGVIPCDCEGERAEMFEDDLMAGNVVMIERRHLDAGIWEPAPCLEGEGGLPVDGIVGQCVECNANIEYGEWHVVREPESDRVPPNTATRTMCGDLDEVERVCRGCSDRPEEDFPEENDGE